MYQTLFVRKWKLFQYHVGCILNITDSKVTCENCLKFSVKFKLIFNYARWRETCRSNQLKKFH
jgi:hypothetical protein